MGDREISLVFSYIVTKGEIKDKMLWFQLTISFRLLQLIAQSIFVRFWKTKVSKFKLRSCLTNGTQFSELSVLTTKIYDFKHFLWDNRYEYDANSEWHPKNTNSSCSIKTVVYRDEVVLHQSKQHMFQNKKILRVYEDKTIDRTSYLYR